MKHRGPVTPDEKLLHLIEKPAAAQTAGAGKKKAFAVLDRLTLLFPTARIKNIGLREVNLTLIWISVILASYLAYYFIAEDGRLEKRFEVMTGKFTGKTPSYSLSLNKDVGNIHTYLSDTEKNNPFHVLPEVTKPKKKDVKAPLQLSLVGILWSDVPQAIIEDKTKGQTHLVNIGSTVDKFTVSDISQIKVTLTSDEGETILK